MYKLICMSFDGDYVTERDSFESVQDAWDRSEDLGSKWYFYPFHFVVTESGKTVVDVPTALIGHLRNRRVNSVAKVFKSVSNQPELDGAGTEEFIYALSCAF